MEESEITCPNCSSKNITKQVGNEELVKELQESEKLGKNPLGFDWFVRYHCNNCDKEWTIFQKESFEQLSQLNAIDSFTEIHKNLSEELIKNTKYRDYSALFGGVYGILIGLLVLFSDSRPSLFITVSTILLAFLLPIVFSMKASLRAKSAMRGIVDVSNIIIGSVMELRLGQNKTGKGSVELWNNYIEAEWVKPEELIAYMYGGLTAQELGHRMSKRWK